MTHSTMLHRGSRMQAWSLLALLAPILPPARARTCQGDLLAGPLNARSRLDAHSPITCDSAACTPPRPGAHQGRGSGLAGLRCPCPCTLATLAPLQPLHPCNPCTLATLAPLHRHRLPGAASCSFPSCCHLSTAAPAPPPPPPPGARAGPQHPPTPPTHLRVHQLLDAGVGVARRQAHRHERPRQEQCEQAAGLAAVRQLSGAHGGAHEAEALPPHLLALQAHEVGAGIAVHHLTRLCLVLVLMPGALWCWWVCTTW